MKGQKYIEMFQAFSNFHKLNLSELYPKMTHVEMVTLKIIADYEKEAEANLAAANQECDKAAKCKGVNISQIVSQLCVAPPAVSRTLNSLEEMGFIERKVNKSDRRNTLVELTKLGRTANTEATRAVESYMDKIIESVGLDEIQKIIDGVNRVYEIAKEELEIIKRENEAIRLQER